MKRTFVILAFFLAACGGGGGGTSGGASIASAPPSTASAATTVVGGASRSTIHGVSILRSAGVYTAQGSANVIGAFPAACSDPKPTLWMDPCPAGEVVVVQSASGWVEEHKLPAHVSQYSAKFELDSAGAMLVDHEGCTYSTGGVRAAIARHPTATTQQIQLERTCPGSAMKSYTAVITDTTSGDAVAGQSTSVYTLLEGTVKVLTINFFTGVRDGKLLAAGVTYAYFTPSGEYARTLHYNTVSR